MEAERPPQLPNIVNKHKMKRIIAIIIVVFIPLAMMAQIQRSLMGCTLGSSTKSSVLSLYPNCQLGISGSDDEDAFCPGLSIHQNTAKGSPLIESYIAFAGIDWSYAYFGFYSNTLCEVVFGSYEHPSAGDWNSLKRTLISKYGKYQKDHSTYQEGDYKIEYYIFSDGKTRIVYNSWVEENGSIYAFTLRYQYISLFDRKFRNKIHSEEL